MVFEVRAIDDDGARDPDPARTVFPIKNSPPELTLSPFVQPPDTTFNIFSFGWTADDPEGAANLERIEIGFNDSTSFTALPPDVDFVTFVASVDRGNSNQTTTSARVYTGLSFAPTNLSVPGLRLNGDNILYVRAVDATDTTSALRRYPATEDDVWYVRKPASRILFVNDYRKSTASTVIPYHLDLLRTFLPAGMTIDAWNLSEPYATGSAGNLITSDALPAVADPTLRQLFAQWDFIYWVSTDATGTVQGNNLPLAAPLLDLFFEQGGKMMVHLPIHVPLIDRDVGSNPATLLLPLSGLPEIPDDVRRLQINEGAAVAPAQSLPGSRTTLPPLQAQGFILNALPFRVESSTIVPLYEAEYTSVSTSGRVPWTGASTVAAITTDNRIALFALPLVEGQSGDPTLAGPDGDPGAAREAVRLILESLGFPKR